jgi:sugar phosphate isomerase/epimerase
MERLGVSTKIFKTFQGKDQLKLLEDSQIYNIELAGDCYEILQSDRQFKILKKELTQSKIKLNSIHVPFCITGEHLDISHPDAKKRDRIVSAALLCLERLAELKGKFLVIHPSHEPISYSSREERLKICVEGLLVLKDNLSKYNDIKVAVENLPRTFLTTNHEEMLKILEKVNSSDFGICLDTNHCSKENLLTTIKIFGPNILTTHISDHNGTEDCHLLPGKGIINWIDCIDTFNFIRYKGVFVYEIYPDRNNFSSDSETILKIKNSFNNLLCK